MIDIRGEKVKRQQGEKDTDHGGRRISPDIPGGHEKTAY